MGICVDKYDNVYVGILEVDTHINACVTPAAINIMEEVRGLLCGGVAINDDYCRMY